MQFLKRHQFFSIGILPPIILVLILLIMLSSSGQLANLNQTASEIGKTTKAVNVFQFARNLLFIAYIANFLVQIFRNKRQRLKSLILSTGIGLFLTLFSYLIAGVSYDLISTIIILVTNPGAITGVK